MTLIPREPADRAFDGIYLLQAKYRYLTMSYLAFLAGVIAATAAYVANAITS